MNVGMESAQHKVLYNVWRLLAILFAIVIIGLPIISLWQVILLLVFILGVFKAKSIAIRALPRSAWLVVACVAFAGISYLLPQPDIQEKNNLYVPMAHGKPIKNQLLPNNVSQYFENTFGRYYPLSQTDFSENSADWQKVVTQPNTKASFSAESIWQQGPPTRHVSSIDFTNYNGLRAGFINDKSTELGYFNFYHRQNKQFLTRAHLPFFVKYQLPQKIASSEFCWQGLVFSSGAASYTPVPHADYSCMRLSQQNLPMSVIGVSFPGHQALHMKLKLSVYWQILAAIKIVCVIAALGALLFLFKIDFMQFASACLFLLVVLLVIDGANHNLVKFADMPVIDGGNDGIIYQGFGRAILFNLMHGKFAQALRGGIDIFYFMPGMRYVCALQSLVFGDTALGLLGLEIWLVFALKRICVILFKRKYAAILLTFFMIVSLKTFTKYAINFNAEIAGYCFLAVALASLLIAIRAGSLSRLSVSAFFFALAVTVRPNFLIGVVFCLLFSVWCLSKQKSFWKSVMAVLPFALVGLVALHNLYFGHRFVPFTSSAFVSHNLILKPHDYWHALQGLFAGVVNLQAVKIFHHLFHDWLNNGVFLLPFIVVMVQMFKRRVVPERRALLFMLLGLQLPFLFWATGNRYTSFIWVLSYFFALEMIFNGLKRIRRSFVPSSTVG